jgi:hypothetical protein
MRELRWFKVLSLFANGVDDAVSAGEADWYSCFAIAPGFSHNDSERANGTFPEQLRPIMVVVYVVSKSVTPARNFGSAWWGSDADPGLMQDQVGELGDKLQLFPKVVRK